MQYDGKKTRNKLKTGSLSLLICLITILVTTTGALAYYYKNQKSDNIKEITSRSSFPVYLPINLPDNYTVNSESYRYESEVLFFDIKGPKNTVHVSQQKNPSVVPDFEKITEQLSFKKTEIGSGTVVYGLEAKKPKAIYSTNTTLIIMNSDESAPLDLLLSILKSMEPVF